MRVLEAPRGLPKVIVYFRGEVVEKNRSIIFSKFDDEVVDQLEVCFSTGFPRMKEKVGDIPGQFVPFVTKPNRRPMHRIECSPSTHPSRRTHYSRFR